jgi:hypothetical protein
MLPRRHPAARRRSVDVATLAEDPFILFPRPLATSLHDAVVSACQQAGFSPKVVQETTQIPVMISLVAAGLGVAIVPSCAQALKWNNVVYRPERAPAPNRHRAGLAQAERIGGRGGVRSELGSGYGCCGPSTPFSSAKCPLTRANPASGFHFHGCASAVPVDGGRGCCERAPITSLSTLRQAHNVEPS